MKLKIILTFILGTTLCFSQKTIIKKLEINTIGDHFTPIINNGKVFFSSNSKDRQNGSASNQLSGTSYGIFEGVFNSSHQIDSIKTIDTKGENLFNMSVCTLSKNGRFMYFTTNSKKLGDNKARRNRTYNLQIQRAEYVDNVGWTNFTTLPFCKQDFNYGHPALSPDGNSLYFVSNIKGVKGKTDIFKVSVFNHSTYGEPQKLSENINSPRTELYPFVSSDNKLYFSSDRQGGLGGSYDIYCFDLNTKDTNALPKALPSPINTLGHDFSFFLTDDLQSGFITSRRYRSYGKTGDKGKGGDDIYYFTEFQPSSHTLNSKGL